MKRINAQKRIIDPMDLIGAGDAALILKITKPTLTRHIAAGKIDALTRLDGPAGVFVFDRRYIEEQAQK